ncbi:MAG: shikimate kinase [Verrucomicrobiota bacterium]
MPIPCKNIVLIGFMGTGKSTVGRLLSTSLAYRFADTDELIVRKAGKKIPAIFEESGEEGFRVIESEVLEDLTKEEGVVIATGGGIVTGEGNIEKLQTLGCVVWLTAKEESIWERVAHNKTRPLLQNDTPRETIQRLLTERLPLYEKAAHLTIGTDGLSASDVSFGILECLRLEKEISLHE